MGHLNNLLLLCVAYERHVESCKQAATKAKLQGDIPNYNRWHFRAAKYARLALDMREEAVALETIPSIAC